MPTTKARNLLYRALLPFCAPGCGPHPVRSVTGHELVHARDFERMLRRHHILGSAALLVSGGHSSLICTSSVSPSHNAYPDTYFRVASITKTAAAALTLRLSEEGLLDLDAPAGSYFNDPSVRSAMEGITLRHLLSHTSGLIDPPGLESALEKVVPFPDLMHEARCCPPGTSFHYSNLGFGLIGCVMEAVTGKPVGEIFRERLFAPLGMNATLEGCLIPSGRIMPVTRVLPYKPGSDLILTPLGSVPLSAADPVRHYGHTAGSMYTDIGSLQILLRMLSGGGSGYLSADSCRQMLKEHASYGALSPGLSYGLGMLRITDSALSDHVIYGHQGFAYGCADGAFWEDQTGRIMITLNGGCSEARTGRLGLANRDFLRFALRKEFPSWSE